VWAATARVEVEVEDAAAVTTMVGEGVEMEGEAVAMLMAKASRAARSDRAAARKNCSCAALGNCLMGCLVGSLAAAATPLGTEGTEGMEGMEGREDTVGTEGMEGTVGTEAATLHHRTTILHRGDAPLPIGQGKDGTRAKGARE
jgi:hypothetical protein